MANENLNDLTKEQLIEEVAKLKAEIKTSRDCNQFYISERDRIQNEANRLQKKLETLKNIIEL
jgi:hypothetical protein